MAAVPIRAASSNRPCYQPVAIQIVWIGLLYLAWYQAGGGIF